jgi:hypothetical protein
MLSSDGFRERDPLQATMLLAVWRTCNTMVLMDADDDLRAKGPSSSMIVEMGEIGSQE